MRWREVGFLAPQTAGSKWCCVKTLRRSRKNPPPVQKKCFQQLHMSIGPTKKVWMENLFATLRTTILKISIFWLILGETRWVAIFRQKSPKNRKMQKNSVFRSPTRFLIQTFFIGLEILCSLWIYMISRHCSSLLVLYSSFSRHFLDCQNPENPRNEGKMTSKDE